MTAARELRAAPDEPWASANQAFLSAALALTAGRVAGEDVTAEQGRSEELARRMASPPALHAIADGFGLSGFERETLLLAAGVELDTKVAQACARAHGDPARPYATFSLAMARLPDPHWTAVSPASPLRSWHLVELAHPEVPTASAVRVDERVLHALAGVGYLDPRIECLAEPLPGPEPLPVGLRAAADRLAELWSSPGGQRVQLRGRRLPDVRSVVSAAAANLGMQPVALRAADLPPTGAERDLLCRLCERETLLDGRCWLLEIDDLLSEAGRAAAAARRLRAPVSSPATCPSTRMAAPSSPSMCLPWLRPSCAKRGGVPSWAPDRTLPVGSTALPVSSASGRRRGGRGRRRGGGAAGPVPGGTAPVERVPIEGAARAGWPRRARRRPRDMGRPGAPRYQARLLRDMAAHVRHHMRVFEDWGFGRRTARGAGVAALFAGPSGTGKTLAAEVLARDLDLDLYRVDLADGDQQVHRRDREEPAAIFDAAESGGACCCSTRPTPCSASAARSRTATTATPTSR